MAEYFNRADLVHKLAAIINIRLLSTDRYAHREIGTDRQTDIQTDRRMGGRMTDRWSSQQTHTEEDGQRQTDGPDSVY